MRLLSLKRQMSGILAASQDHDVVLRGQEDESVDQDNCSQLRSSDLSGSEKKRRGHAFIWFLSCSLFLSCIYLRLDSQRKAFDYYFFIQAVYKALT